MAQLVRIAPYQSSDEENNGESSENEEVLRRLKHDWTDLEEFPSEALALEFLKQHHFVKRSTNPGNEKTGRKVRKNEKQTFGNLTPKIFNLFY